MSTIPADETITLCFDLKIEPTDIDRLMDIWERYVNHVKATEPGALVYTWNVSEDLRSVFILEHYRSASAVIEHGPNIAQYSVEMAPYRTINKLTVLGNPSKALLGVLKDRYPTEHFKPAKGFSRFSSHEIETETTTN